MNPSNPLARQLEKYRKSQENAIDFLASSEQSINPSKQRQHSSPQVSADSGARLTEAAAAAAEPQQQGLKRLLAGSKSGVNQRPKPQPVQQPAALNAPLAFKVRKVLEYLKQASGAPVTPQQVLDATGFDPTNEPDLSAALQDNPRVEFQGLSLCYVPNFKIKNRNELLHHIRRCPDGTDLKDIENSYKGIPRDIEQLKAEGRAVTLLNLDLQRIFIYPSDETLRINVDPDLINLYREIQVPSDPQELRSAAEGAGLTSALATVVRKRSNIKKPVKEKKKKARKWQANHVTNAHLPELFVGAQPDKIEG